MPNRAALVAELVAAGMPRAAAEDYVDQRHGWADIRLRPYYRRLAAARAEAEGRAIHEVVSSAIEEYCARGSEKGPRWKGE